MTVATQARPRRKQRSRRRGEAVAICGATKPRGGLCRREPGAGTDHPGVGPCSLHGGNDKSVKREALVQSSLSTGADSILWDGPPMGVAERMDPTDALTWCIAIAAGEVRYLTARVAELDHSSVTGRIAHTSREWGEGEKGTKDIKRKELGEARLHVLVEARQVAVDRLARLSKMALEAGVAERQVALAENQASFVIESFGRMMEQLGLTAKQKVKLEPIMERELLQIEGGTVLG